MSEGSEIFWLFPIYDILEDAYYMKPIELITENEQYDDYIRQLIDIKEGLYNENYEGFYDENNVKAFLLPAETFEEEFPNKITLMRKTLFDWENWRDEITQDEKDMFTYYKRAIKNDTLCELAKRKSIYDSAKKTFLLINQYAFRCSNGRVSISCNSLTFDIEVQNANFKQVLDWFSKNRKPQRVFNLNPKHGEYGKGAHSSNKGNKVSLLLCGRDEAEKLLLRAINTDDRENKTLYFYDTNKTRYIEFKKEFKNVYHGFHLDIKDEKRISQELKERIDRLK